MKPTGACFHNSRLKSTPRARHRPHVTNPTPPSPRCHKSNTHPPCHKSNTPVSQIQDPPPRVISNTPLLSPPIHLDFYSKRAVSISLSVDIIAVFAVHKDSTSSNSFSISLSVGSITVFAVHWGTTALNSFSFSQNVDNIALLVVHRVFCLLKWLQVSNELNELDNCNKY